MSVILFSKRSMSYFAIKKYGISILIIARKNNNIVKRFFLKKIKTFTIHELKTKSKFYFFKTNLTLDWTAS